MQLLHRTYHGLKLELLPKAPLKFVCFTPLAESFPSKQFHPNLFKATEIP